MHEDDYRIFDRATGGEVCHFCGIRAVYIVEEKESGEEIATCERHKYTAFS